uniref:Uncharacterized protein n=1 Tax=Wuchereria bancrofti TaxID=6293 RepID=A0A1I8EQN9_WUCBA
MFKKHDDQVVFLWKIDFSTPCRALPCSFLLCQLACQLFAGNFGYCHGAMDLYHKFAQRKNTAGIRVVDTLITRVAFMCADMEVDTSQKKFVERLREAFAIPSISGQPQRRADVIHGPVDEDGTTIILSAIFRSKLGANVELCDIGKQTLSDGSIINLPLVLFGTLDNNKAKKTLLIYDHLDDGKLYGRGSTDDKGPTPFVHYYDFEAMEKSDSLGLEEILAKKNTFLNNVNFTCISDSYWLGKTKPCISYGLRYEPMADLVWVIVKGCGGKHLDWRYYEFVTNEERKLYETLDFDVVCIIYCHCAMKLNHFLIVQEEYRADIGAIKLLSDSKEKILMKRWRYSTLSLHGIDCRLLSL